VVRSTAAVVRTETAALERQAAHADSTEALVAERRQADAAAAVRQTALRALNTQGPRLARFLETVAQSAPEALVVTSIGVQTDGERWRVEVSGIAVAEDAAASQGAVSSFLGRMADSPFAGAPVQAPSFRVLSGTGGAAAYPVNLPAGMSGVAFTARFAVAK
jgi:Tfp pilus assembly protein PilN